MTARLLSERVLAAPSGIACLLGLELVGNEEEGGVDTRLALPPHAPSEKDTILSIMYVIGSRIKSAQGSLEVVQKGLEQRVRDRRDSKDREGGRDSGYHCRMTKLMG